MSRIRNAFTEIARNDALGPLVASTPLGRGLVQRVAGGETGREVLASVEDLTDAGRYVALERSWSHDLDLDAAVADYEEIIMLLGSCGLGPVSEIVISSALLEVPRGPEAFGELCAQAQDNATPITLSADSSAAVDPVLAMVQRQQAIGRDVGISLPAALRRTERDCAIANGRVRIVKGTNAGGDAFGHGIEVDKSFIRCAKVLLKRGDAVRPSFATHDGRIIEIIQTLAGRYGRERIDMEFALYLGRSGSTQQRLIDSGEQVRIYVPFGPEWFGRLVGGLAERPHSVGTALRALLPGA